MHPKNMECENPYQSPADCSMPVEKQQQAVGTTRNRLLILFGLSWFACANKLCDLFILGWLS